MAYRTLENILDNSRILKALSKKSKPKRLALMSKKTRDLITTYSQKSRVKKSCQDTEINTRPWKEILTELEFLATIGSRILGEQISIVCRKKDL